MPQQIVLLSGPVCAGKSTLAQHLVSVHGATHFKTQHFLRKIGPNVFAERESYQRLGERLDTKTNGAWVRDALLSVLAENPSDEFDDALIIIDAVRIIGQIDALRSIFGRKVFHIHLTAPFPILKSRYQKRVRQKKGDLQELTSYERVRENRTERKVEKLALIADVVVDTKRCTEEDVVTRAAACLGLYGRECLRNTDVLIGGQYGSEGKGQVAAYLAPEYDILMRVGGPNAGHKVYQEPEPYTYHHLPSGTKSNPNAKLIIGPGAVLNVPNLLREIGECGVEADRLAIDEQAMIITDEDRAQEKMLQDAIGSTGQGVGFATARKILGRSDKSLKLAKDVVELKPFIRKTWLQLQRAYRLGEKVFLEGTQGFGLSIHHGKYPYVTSRDTTVSGCLAEAGISPSRVRKIIMVCRTYPIRVQSPQDATSGPMSQELSWREISKRSGVSIAELNSHERTSTTKRERRVAEFDWTLLRKAASMNAPTDIALTFVDYLKVGNRDARRFDQLDEKTIRFAEEVERVTCAPVSLISTRFHSRSIIDRRAW